MRNYIFTLVVAGLLVLPQSLLACSFQGPSGETLAVSVKSIDGEKVAASRSFEFSYGGSVVGAAKGQVVDVWIPIPPSTKDQQVEVLSSSFPVVVKQTTETTYNNKLFYFQVKARDSKAIAFQIRYRIKRNEILSRGDSESEKQRLANDQRRSFLKQNSMVPTTGRPVELFDQFASLNPVSDVDQAMQVYRFVGHHLKYDKSKDGYGNGDVLWTCNSKTGNCTDFHSLFISVARNKKIPAKFQIGFPLPPKRGKGKVKGYHCWAKFYQDGRGWVPVDISEADKHPELKDYYFGNLTENRVLFSTGRDLTLSPPQAGKPLNYLIYPYVEIDKKAASKNNLLLDFSYQDR